MAKADSVPICLLWQGPQGAVSINTDQDASYSALLVIGDYIPKSYFSGGGVLVVKLFSLICL